MNHNNFYPNFPMHGTGTSQTPPGQIHPQIRPHAYFQRKQQSSQQAEVKGRPISVILQEQEMELKSS